MEDIQKVADAVIPVTRLLYEQLRYPVWQGCGTSRETEEVGDEFRFGICCGAWTNASNFTWREVETNCRSELEGFMPGSAFRNWIVIYGCLELFEQAKRLNELESIAFSKQPLTDRRAGAPAMAGETSRRLELKRAMDRGSRSGHVYLRAYQGVARQLAAMCPILSASASSILSWTTATPAPKGLETRPARCCTTCCSSWPRRNCPCWVWGLY
jgi:hypothetical protein